MPLIKKEQKKNNNVGDLTNDYIKQNQELLNEMKKEARNQTYEDWFNLLANYGPFNVRECQFFGVLLH